MAGSGGGPGTDLIQELLEHPEQFDFFQAVRLIELYVTQERNHPRSSAVGSDRGPHTEPICFRALPSLSFPSGQIAALHASEKAEAGAEDACPLPVDMTVSFMGLTGPNGALPQHYTTLLIERSHQRHKDNTLREFFDLFNHRIISLFFRAWEKYRFPFAYERNVEEGAADDDLFTRCLFSLVGLQLPGLRDRFSFDDQTMVSYGGLLAQQTRSAAGLEQILCDYFSIHASVVQFVGQWLYLPDDCQSSLPSPRNRSGQNLTLGDSAVVGGRVWDVQCRVRVQLGPLRISDFNGLMPDGDRLAAVAEMIRFYIGMERDFDIQLVLRKQDVPDCRLEEKPDYKPRLGWNTWLKTKSRTEDVTEAIFRMS
ncbi:MAG: type VI secretion system baseplate subunit TssG [Fuerstiella sp.]